MPLIVLEGLTGAGKSSTLAALQTALAEQGQRLRIVYEEESFGELMDEVAHVPAETLCHRLEAVLATLPDRDADWVILERFHPSYYALRPDWTLYAAIDRRLATLGCGLVLLSYPEAMIRTRALYRGEREADGWSQGFIALYGSEARALEALNSSWRLREQTFGLSALPKLRLDTSAGDWNATAARIIAWAGQQEQRPDPDVRVDGSW